MITSSHHTNGITYQRSVSTFSPSLSISNSRATSQESDLFSFRSTFGEKLNKYKERSPRTSNLSSYKYPLSSYRKSKTFKNIRLDEKGFTNSTDGVLDSSQLSIKIAEFLHRTDHVTDEWKRIGKKEKKIQCANSQKRVNEYRKGIDSISSGYEYAESLKSRTSENTVIR